MKLTLKRIALKPTYTIGRLSVNGERLCDTIEDRVRGRGEMKVPGETAIPYGRYKVTLKVRSPKFSSYRQYQFCGGYLPRLLNVPGFEGVLIHIGNTADDSSGCILVGENKAVGRVINSTDTFRRLYELLKEADNRGEDIEIEII